ncbi:MAG: hypothetical protein U0Z75_03430 [Deinococcaceae bacterium]
MQSVFNCPNTVFYARKIWMSEAELGLAGFHNPVFNEIEINVKDMISALSL